MRLTVFYILFTLLFLSINCSKESDKGQIIEQKRQYDALLEKKRHRKKRLGNLERMFEAAVEIGIAEEGDWSSDYWIGKLIAIGILCKSEMHWLYGVDRGSKTWWEYGALPGSKHYWERGSLEGSEAWWNGGVDKGSKVHWMFGTGEGSKTHWQHGTGEGSKEHWNNGTW